MSVREADTRSQWWQSFVDNAAEEWEVSAWVVGLIVAIPVLLPILGIVAGVLHRPTFDLLTMEDGPGEWVQVLAWLGALVFTVAVARRLVGDLRLTAFLYLIVAAGIVFIIGEEISWGQRLLGWGTPEGLSAINRQEETNLHNIFGVQDLFSWGMFSVGLYGTLAPLITWWSSGPYAAWSRRTRLLVPHWILVPYFALMLAWRFYRNLFEPPAEYYVGISRFGEITELVLALALLAFAWHQWRTAPEAT